MNQDSTIIFPHDTLLEDVSFDDYKAARGINASGLKDILKSPLHFRYARDNPRKDTPAMRLGRFAHTALLEPEQLGKMYVAPDVNLRTNQGKADLAAWRKTLPGDAMEVTPVEYEHMQGIINATREHRMLRRLLDKGQRETSLFFKEPSHHLLAKCRYDFVAHDTEIICDIKTTSDASAESFAKDAYKFNYALSASMYLEAARLTGVANPDRFIWIALESKPPYAVALYEVSVDFLNFGHQLYTMAMERYAQCMATGQWPGFSEKFQTLEPPGYARLP